MAELELVERTQCPVCRRDAPDPFLTLPYWSGPIAEYLRRHYESRLDPSRLDGQHYELVECPGCTLVFERWVPTPAALSELYGDLQGRDRDEVSARRGLDVRVRYAYDIERLIRYVGKPPGEVSVLDFGAGTGLWLDMAAALGCRTAAVELSDTAAHDLAATGHIAQNLDELAPASVDYVETEQVFEHLVDPRSVAKALSEALRPGGILRISVPNGTGMRDRIPTGDWSAPKGSAGSLEPVAPLEHLNCFSHRSLMALAGAAGLVPFVFPLRTEVHPTARIRYAASAFAHQIRRPTGTMLFFQRPSRS